MSNETVEAPEPEETQAETDPAEASEAAVDADAEE